jgi:hypothetical protein
MLRIIQSPCHQGTKTQKLLDERFNLHRPLTEKVACLSDFVASAEGILRSGDTIDVVRNMNYFFSLLFPGKLLMHIYPQ